MDERCLTGKLLAVPHSVDHPSSLSEQVVLLDEAGNRVGVADKLSTHDGNTPLHLAFSCYIFDAAGRLLITQRAHDKKVFPSVWTNSVCGHPADGESLESAVRRRAIRELGLAIEDVRLVLPRFRYRAESNGIVENEMCPVVVASAVGSLAPAADEVAQTQWVDWEAFAQEVIAHSRLVSPWCQLQVEQLNAIGSGPSQWPTADDSELPSALSYLSA